jgi:thioredoxin-like negative regulator of GroEL
MVTRIVEEIAQEYDGRIKCYRLDADDYPQVATAYNIDRIPTVLLFKDGEKIHSITGTLPKAVYSLFARLISHQPAVLFSQNEPATSNQPQPASSTLLSEQTSTSHQPPANRTGCM